MKKKLAILVIGLMVMGILAGCGAGSDQAGTKAAEDVIKIGGNFELSGGVATFGQEAVNGAKMAFEEINAAGGVLGKKIEFIPLDNKSDATESTNVATKLITQEKVVAIIGSTTSGNTLGAVQVADDNQIPLISPSATNPDVTVNPDTKQTRPFIFRTCFIDPFQGTVMANFALKTLGAKTAAVYVDNQAPYSKGLAAAFVEAFKKGGGAIIAEEAYITKDTEFKPTLTKINGKKPDVLYVPGYYEEVGLIVKQARELGMTMPIMGGDGWDSPKLAEIAGAANLNNTFFSNHYSSQQQDEKVQKFVKAYQAKYNAVPGAFGVLGYDSALLVVDAIKKAGSAEPAKIKEALEQAKDVELVTGTISFDSSHNPVKGAVILELKDGQQTFKEYVKP